MWSRRKDSRRTAFLGRRERQETAEKGRPTKAVTPPAQLGCFFEVAMDRIRVGLIGYGYWGPNLIRNFAACPLTEVAAVCDASPARQAAVTRTYPGMKVVASVDELLELPLDAVAIATPVSTHFPLA